MGVRPIRIHVPDASLNVTVVRGVGFTVSCPRCGARFRGRKVSTVRGELRDHRALTGH